MNCAIRNLTAGLCVVLYPYLIGQWQYKLVPFFIGIVKNSVLSVLLERFGEIFFYPRLFAFT